MAGTRASPVVLIQCASYDRENGMQFLFLDLGGAQMVKQYCSKPTLKMLKYLPRVFFSYNGLVVFETFGFRCLFRDFILYNPITQQELFLKRPYSASYICAIYFHSLAREYSLIYTFRNRNAIANCWHYAITTVDFRLWFQLPTPTFAPPLIDGLVNINGYVYWMINTNSNLIDYTAPIPPLCTASIITFHTETEEIRVMAHPGRRCRGCRDEQPFMQLLQADNSLLYARVYRQFIEIWVLQDSTKWLWAHRYNINLNFDVKLYPSVENLCYNIRLFYIPDGQLVMCWYGVGLFQYHLELKTFRKIDVIINGQDVMSHHRNSIFLTSYTKSFESV